MKAPPAKAVASASSTQPEGCLKLRCKSWKANSSRLTICAESHSLIVVLSIVRFRFWLMRVCRRL